MARDYIDAEVNDGKTEEKKENGLKSFFKKAKASLDSSILEDNIRSTYDKNHDEYTIYKKESTLGIGSSVYGEMTNNSLVIFGEPEIELNSLIVKSTKEHNGNAYFICGTEKATVKVVVEGVEYERPGTKLILDGDVQEVNVIKGDNRYFIYKGDKK